MKQKWFFKGIGFLAFMTMGIMFIGMVIMMLWNWLMPELFGLPFISFGQALGLFVLSRILFGGPFGKRSHYKSKVKRKWRSRMQEKWSNMTPEEREKFQKGMRCGKWGEFKEEKKSDSSTDFV